MNYFRCIFIVTLTVLSSCNKERYETTISTETMVTNVWKDSASIEVSATSSNKSIPLTWCVSYSEYAGMHSNQTVIDESYKGASNYYKIKLRDLSPNTTYYVQPYAYANGQRYYSTEEISFTTNNCPDMIGETGPGGGIIFEYDCNGNGQEFFLIEQMGSWACASNTFIGASTSQFEGTGLQNSQILAQYCTDPTAAFNVCLNFSNNGYSDWYLPALDDYKTIRNNLYTTGLWTPSADYFLTSSKYQSTTRYNYTMTTGNVSTSPVTSNSAYLIVRSF